MVSSIDEQSVHVKGGQPKWRVVSPSDGWSTHIIGGQAFGYFTEGQSTLMMRGQQSPCSMSSPSPDFSYIGEWVHTDTPAVAPFLLGLCGVASAMIHTLLIDV